MAKCVECGTSIGLMNSYGPNGAYCKNCNATRLRDAGDTAKATERQRLAAEIEAVLVTTEMQPDIGITKRITIITAECAYGMNIFKDLFASVRNIVGGRSEAVQKTMRDARETVLYELKREAHRVGANAVVGVDLDYTQLGDGGAAMVMLVASGTAVVIDQHTEAER